MHPRHCLLHVSHPSVIMRNKFHSNTLPGQGISSKKRYLFAELRWQTGGNEDMGGWGCGCKTSNRSNSLCIFQVQNKGPQNPGITATAVVFAVSASGDVQGGKYLTGVGDRGFCVKISTWSSKFEAVYMSHIVSVFNIGDTYFSQKRKIKFREFTPTNSKLAVGKK